MSDQRVGVIGCGTIGTGMVEICARAGLDVVVVGRSQDSLDAGRHRLLSSVDLAAARGRVSEKDRDALLARVAFTTDLTQLYDRNLLFEAVAEQEEDKTKLFAALDKIVVDEKAILASGTSSIPILQLALATHQPGRVVGLHFFNPVQTMKLVEVIGSPLSADSTVTRAELFVTKTLGKRAIRSPDRVGFVVNTLIIPFMLSAIRMVESGVASAEAIDRGMILGCAHPVGPLKLADIVGLDVLEQTANALYQEYREPQFQPPSLLSRMVVSGLLGKKTGRGFYSHR
ncbi:3-hydroxybutyryl-CoA dehydrogenase [Streptomyces sp. NPDC059680]|uniref:3-hydroxybutyryl-CoA dehydrogenase n=1 Tax=Streptomyces sp. NPDC059680 TaxID=3346904 RepID=UPI0036CC5ECD